MDKKNFIIMALIFIIPMVAYKIMSKPTIDTATKTVMVNQPQIIKFSSQMCVECKKLESVLDEVYPKYSDKISLVKIQVSDTDDNTKNLIKKYDIILTPTMVILNAKGEKLSQIEGFVEKEKLETIMKDLVKK